MKNRFIIKTVSLLETVSQNDTGGKSAITMKYNVGKSKNIYIVIYNRENDMHTYTYLFILDNLYSHFTSAQ